jgi:hypothetical protein
MQAHRYHARELREVRDELERLQEKVALLDRDLAEDSYDSSYETRGQLSLVSLGLRRAHGAIGCAEGRL